VENGPGGEHIGVMKKPAKLPRLKCPTCRSLYEYRSIFDCEPDPSISMCDECGDPLPEGEPGESRLYIFLADPSLTEEMENDGDRTT
jgi:hypothetical protein